MSTKQRRLFQDFLERNGHALRTWIRLPTVESVQLAGPDKSDFGVVDLEHAPYDMHAGLPIIELAKASGLSPLVRIPSSDREMIQRVCDSGADGIIFSRVGSPADARLAVRALRVPTESPQGAGNTSVAAQGGALNCKESLKRCREQVVCIVQIQTAEAARAAGDIASVDGVDAVLISAADLAAREGKRETDPTIIELVADAVAAVKLAGVPVGNTREESFAGIADDMGYDFTLLRREASSVANPARRAVATERAVAEASHRTSSTWQPSLRRRQEANVEVFRQWLAINRGRKSADYADLQRWSATEITDFWGAIWSFFDIAAYSPQKCVLVEESMPGAQWFPGATLNYVDQIFRHRDAGETAVIDECEPGGPGRRTTSWKELERQVGAVADTLRRNGVQAGDRVVGYLPNITEAIVSFLATASLGALWASCGQDYSAPAAVDRLGQLEPTVLIAADGYRFAGKSHDRREAIAYIRDNIPSLQATIAVPRLGLPLEELGPVIDWSQASAGHAPLETIPLPFDHPLWVLFSSGTTGRPKGIVHSHGGVLLEHLKSVSFHLDLGPGDVYFWYTSASWMMWNFQVSGLLVGATIVCYDGSPTYPATDAIWALSERNRVTFLGTSPGYLQACQKDGLSPALTHDLTPLRTLGVTGSVLHAEANAWVADHVASDVQVASMSGGTDIVSAFATAVPTVPVHAGEISVIALGAALESWGMDRRPLIGEVGELVLTKPMPSMPLRFWGDLSGERYRHAYFDRYPGVWRHGDWVTVSEHGTVTVHGRSDSTLNRQGVRMGSADIYQAVEKLPEICEALVIGVEYPDGTYWMPLFVTLAKDATLDDDLIVAIQDIIRKEASPRHIPDDIIAAPAIPRTRTGKKLEIPIKRLFQGADVDTILDPQSTENARVLPWYIEQAAQRRNGVFRS
jgi:acetoacetyl-CoA synthetase